MEITGPTLDAADPAALARFYSRLLGWPIVAEGPRPASRRRTGGPRSATRRTG